MTNSPYMRRFMTLDDVETVAMIDAQAFIDWWPVREFVTHLFSPNVRASLVDYDGRPIGYFVSWTLPEGVCHLARMAVTPAFRGQGIARMLMDDAIKNAVQESCHTILLDAAEGDSTIEWYKRLGFRQTGIRRGYYRLAGKDAVVMEKRLAT